MGIAEILILGIDANVRERIGAGADQAHRNDFRREPKGPEFPCVFSPNRLRGNPPVRRDATDRALSCWYDAEGTLRVGPQWPITAELQIKRIVEEAIAGEAGNLLCVYLLDKCAGSRHRRQLRAYEWEAPGGDRIPDILDRRIVVDACPPEQSVAVDVDLLRNAYVGIVPRETVIDAVIGSLNECAEVVGDFAAGKKTRLLQDEIVIDAKSRHASRLSILVRKSRLQHDRKRRAFPIAAIKRVAAQLKAAAERRSSRNAVW